MKACRDFLNSGIIRMYRRPIHAYKASFNRTNNIMNKPLAMRETRPVALQAMLLTCPDGSLRNLIPGWPQTAIEYSMLPQQKNYGCLLYTSDAADERSSVDL